MKFGIFDFPFFCFFVSGYSTHKMPKSECIALGGNENNLYSKDIATLLQEQLSAKNDIVRCKGKMGVKINL